MKKESLKRMVVLRIVGVIIVIILTGAIFLLGSQVQNIRRELFIKQLSLEGSLKVAVYQASLQEQLDEYKVDIIRVERMMPIEDEIGSIIGSFAAEAKKIGVTVKVPKVQEEIILDQDGTKVDQTGLLRAVRMQIDAQGKPTDLIEFMHTIEHLPFLLGTVSFVFNSDSDSDSAARGLVITGPGSRPPGAQPEKPESRRASLKMEIRLTTRVEERIE